MTRDGTTVDLFFSYSHDDEELRDALAKHLALLVRQGFLRTWHDRRIDPGSDWDGEIDAHLEKAGIILLLISASFLNSDYCFDREMKRALERHAQGDAIVVPVLLRPCDWKSAPFADLQSLPKNLAPVTSWTNPDDALAEIALGIRDLLATPQIAVDFSSSETRELSLQLESAYERRAEIASQHEDTRELDELIVEIKRKLRAGPQLEPGDFLLEGRFRLLQTIGRGGFATVWKAYDRRQKSLVAIKILHSQYSKDRSRLERFFRGARQMARLKHPGIVSVLEPKCDDGGYFFFVMELVVGGDFRQAVLTGRLNREERLRVLLEVGATLSVAHQQGVFHRDIKPANILLTADGRAKLTDFDLVRAIDTTGGTRTTMLGTVIYAAPEAMLDGKQAAEPADVYSLGMTTVFALYGSDLPMEVHFDSDNFLQRLEAAPGELAAIRRALSKDSTQRWPTIADYCHALKHSLDEENPGEEQPEQTSAHPAGLARGSTIRLLSLLGVTLALAFLLPSENPRFSKLRGLIDNFTRQEHRIGTVRNREPTESLEAYQAYLQGKDLNSRRYPTTENWQRAISKFEKAVGIDPSFALAWAELAECHAQAYHLLIDRTPERLEKAQNAVDQALELAPNLPDAHRALGYYYYWGHNDYDQALRAFGRAASVLPNDSQVAEGIALIRRQQGRFDEALQEFERALSLVPQSSRLASELAATHTMLRRYDDAAKNYLRSIDLNPEQALAYQGLALNHVLRSGDFKEARQLLTDMPLQNELSSAMAWYYQEMRESNYAAAIERLEVVPLDILGVDWAMLPKSLLHADAYRRMGDEAQASLAYRRATFLLERIVKFDLDDPRRRSALARAYSGLGNHDQAVSQAQLAVDLTPSRVDAISNPGLVENLAEILMLSGQAELAIEQLEHLLSVPSNFSRQLLRVDARWDPLREHPRFVALVDLDEIDDS